MTKIQKLTIEILVTDDGKADLATTEEIVNDIQETIACYDAIFIGSRTTDMIEMSDLKLMPDPEPEPEPTTDDDAEVCPLLHQPQAEPTVMVIERGKRNTQRISPSGERLTRYVSSQYVAMAKSVEVGQYSTHNGKRCVWLTDDQRQAISDLVRESTQARKAKKVSHA
tara:strand:+ start:1442 stop:1945 length:504 start_codon:yes stop_codon:yes gene_type:complete